MVVLYVSLHYVCGLGNLGLNNAVLRSGRLPDSSCILLPFSRAVGRQSHVTCDHHKALYVYSTTTCLLVSPLSSLCLLSLSLLLFSPFLSCSSLPFSLALLSLSLLLFSPFLSCSSLALPSKLWLAEQMQYCQCVFIVSVCGCNGNFLFFSRYSFPSFLFPQKSQMHFWLAKRKALETLPYGQCLCMQRFRKTVQFR